MEKTKNGITINKALMLGTTLVSLNALSVAKAQAASCTNCSMSAIILTPIVITGSVDMQFGSMTEAGAGGTMTLDTANVRVGAAGVTAVGGAAPFLSGVLSVSGATGVPIVISMNAATFTVDDAGTGVAMNVDLFNIRTNGGGATQTVTMTASPTTYPIGGRLSVGAAQVAGTYTGTYVVNANY